MPKSAKEAEQRIAYPSAEGWQEFADWARREPEIKDCDAEAIGRAVQDAMSLCTEIQAERAAEPVRSDAVKKAKAIESLLTKLEHLLHGRESLKSLRSIKADEQFAHLLSFAAISEAVTSDALEDPLDPSALSALRAQSEFRRETFSLASLDRHFGAAKKAAIGSATGEVMLHAVRKLREPIRDWLFVAAQHKGGRSRSTARQCLLSCLMRDYEAIFGKRLDWTTERHLVVLTTALFPLCSLSTEGLEDAVYRAVREIFLWAEWARQGPMPSAQFGPPLEEAPDDDAAA